MNKEDFERLKAVCEKEGFELELSSPWDQTYRISKKDIWDGVEFFEGQDGVIRPMTDDMRYIINNGKIHITSKPSTEQSYIEQLKKEAHERFGEIKEGVVIHNLMINSDYPKESKIYGNNFYYEKEEDRLLVGSKDIRTCIYQQGKWATRVKERVKVEFRDHVAVGNYDYHSHSFTIDVLRNAKQFDPEKAGQFIASQLEAYLNLDRYSVDVSGETLSIHVKIKNGVDLEDLKEKSESLAKIVKKI